MAGCGFCSMRRCPLTAHLRITLAYKPLPHLLAKHGLTLFLKAWLNCLPAALYIVLEVDGCNLANTCVQVSLGCCAKQRNTKAGAGLKLHTNMHDADYDLAPRLSNTSNWTPAGQVHIKVAAVYPKPH